MADNSGLPPEGWYPDRPNATRLRHWTGTGWTNEFRPIAATPTPEPAVTAPTTRTPEPEPVRETTDQARSRRELRAQVGSLAQDTPDTPPVGVRVVPDPDPHLSTVDQARVAGGYAPLRHQAWQESFVQKPDLRTGNSQTFAGWLYATSPLWIGALLIAGMTVLSLVNPLLVHGGLGIVGFAMTFLLARQDIRHLTDRGYRAPSLWWVLLPFFYFVVRMIRVGARGAAMVVTYLLSTVALVGLLYVAFIGNPALLSLITPSIPATSSAVPTPVVTLSAQERANLLTADGVEAQLRVDLAKTFDVGAVDCEPFASTTVGTTTTCVVVLDGVTYNAGLQVTPEEPDAAFVVTGMLPAQG